MNWRRWPWIEHGALPLSVLVMRLSWLWLWLLILGRWLFPPEMRPILPLWMVTVLALGGALTARIAPQFLEQRRARALAAGMGLGAMLFVVWWRVARVDSALWDVRWVADEAVALTHWNGVLPLSAGVLATSAYLWLSGIRDSAAPNHDDIWRAFASGFVALVLLLIAGRLDPSGPPVGTTVWIVLFFAVGMTSLAMVGLRTARGIRNTAAPLPVNRYWAGSIVTIVVLLLLAGFLLALFVTPEGVAQAMGGVSRVLGWIANIVGYVLYALVYVLFLVLTPLIHWLESRMGSWFQFDTERMQDMQRGLMEPPDQPGTVTLPPAVDESLRWVFLLIAIVIVAIAFASALRRLRKREADNEDEVRETILTQALLRDQAQSLWQRWRDRLFPSHSGATSPFLSLGGVVESRRRVRAAYQAFLAAMMVHNNARAPSVSPHRFAETARAIVPASSEAIDRLTERYMAARYAPIDPTMQEATDAETAWSDIRTSLDTITE